ncbi:MAG: hypothetical protein PHS61_04645, partial [Candidatus Omnitrophica bacterium]|nr:hypothetical protein [Candidatus Omnitrophota bacterium]
PPKAETISKAEPPKAEPPKAEPPKAEQTPLKDVSVEKKFGLDPAIAGQKAPGTEPVKPELKSDEIPGFTKIVQTKVDIKKDVPGDVEFFKASAPQTEEGKPEAAPVEEPFKFTPLEKPSSGSKADDVSTSSAKDKNSLTDFINANKPVAPPGPPEKKDPLPVSQRTPDKPVEPPQTKPADIVQPEQGQGPQGKPSTPREGKPLDAARDKQKSKKETLIPGFHPKDKEEKPE